jgi:polysaccharide chain length determinant protein (PEP-CTERM system associated)
VQIVAEVRRYARSGWRHRWKALALAWVVCLAGWGAVYTLPDQYQSSARLYADADAVLGQLLRDLAVDSSPANQVELLQRTLLSRPNLERVIARTDLDLRVRTVPEREAMLDGLGKAIRVVPQTRNLFTISYVDRNPALARDVVQTLLNLFVEQASNKDRQQIENARVFVNRQIAAYEAQLREAEQRRADFRARYAELLPDIATGITGLEQARGRLQRLNGELEDTKHRRELLRQQLEATPAQLVAETASGGGGGNDGALAEAIRRRTELVITRTENHPDVRAQDALIASLRASGGGRSQAVPRSAANAQPRANPLHEQLKLRLVDVDANITSLERQIREEQATVARLDEMTRSAPQVQAQFLNLDRDYNVLRRNYEELLERREAVLIGGAARATAERVRLEVVDPPTLPLGPSGPNRLLLSSMVLAAGLGAAAALALLLVQLDRGFYTLHDLRRLGLPVLGGISAADPPPRTGFAVASFAVGVVLLVAAYGAVLAGGPTLAAKLPRLLARMVA